MVNLKTLKAFSERKFWKCFRYSISFLESEQSQVGYFETDQSTISVSFLSGDSKVSHLFIAESHLLSYLLLNS